MIKLKLLQQAYPTGDYKTYQANAVNIKQIESFKDDDVDIYTVYWARFSDDKIRHLDDESEYCNWEKIYKINLNGREQNTEDFEIVE